MKKLLAMALVVFPAASFAADLRAQCIENITTTSKQVPNSVFIGQQQPVCDCVVADVTAGGNEWIAAEIDAYYDHRTDKNEQAMSIYQKALSVCSEKIIGRDKIIEESKKIKGPYNQR